MVRAILAGTKTQTRRLFWSRDGAKRMLATHVTPLATGVEWWAEPFGWEKCPYGVPGERLWVRETWGFIATVPTSAHRQAIKDRLMFPYGGYRADIDESKSVETLWCWRSPIHMPRWASRITLEVTEVRVQRLQDISEEDAKADGAERYVVGHGFITEGDLQGEPGYWSETLFRNGFSVLWDSINGKRAPWDSNPWVWAITFRRVV